MTAYTLDSVWKNRSVYTIAEGRMNPGDHVRLTKKAIELYVAHAGGKHSRWFDHYRRDVCVGCVVEDLLPLHVRLTNWHFFPENEALQPRKKKVLGYELTVYPTSKRLCERRVEQFDHECVKRPSKNLFRLIGRILHHVQDMSTPAHVIPVYHDPRAPDSYESYSKKHMADRLRSVDIREDRFSELRSELSGSFDLYDRGARATLAYLYQSRKRFPCLIDGKLEAIACDALWKRSSDHGGGREAKGGNGFGRYGVLGRHFGITRVEVGDRVYEVAADVFRALHQDLVQKALEDSLRVMMFAEARIRES